MSLLAPQLQAVIDNFQKNGPEALKTPVNKSKEDLLATFDRSQVIKVGDKVPAFTLPDAVGKTQSSSDLLKNGPIVLTFYRGEWCPFCNIAISGFQKYLEAFKAKGVTIVAITPQLPNGTLTMTEKHNLAFPVCTDLHNEYAHKLGIVWNMPNSLKPVYEALHHDLTELNGDDSFAVPIPATFLVDTTGTIRNVFFDPDYIKRAEPTTVLEWIDAL
jgi:peroxiredoxin